MRKSLPILLASIVASAVAAPAQAAETLQGITASPYSQSFSLSPGAKYSGTVNISNPGDTEYDFTVSAAPFSVVGEDYAQQFTVRPDLVDASKWFTFPTTRYHLKPGQQTPVPYSVQPPADIAGGGYYAAVFAQADALPGPGVRGQKRVGVLTYMTISGDVHRSGKLAGFTVPLFQTEPPLHTQVRIQNTGNVHFDTTTSVKAQDLFGNVKWEQTVDHVIMPKSTRKSALDWSKSPSFGLYRVSGTVKYLGNTDKLPTRWTLMLSANAFLIIAGVLILMGLYAFLTRRQRGNVYRKR